MFYLKYLNKYQDTNNPNILTMLISKKKPDLNLKKPNSTQLLLLAPYPKEWVNRKKFFTTPSGMKKDTNKLNIVPTIIPINKTKNIKLIFLFILYITF